MLLNCYPVKKIDGYYFRYFFLIDMKLKCFEIKVI